MTETPDYVFVPDPIWTEGLKSGWNYGKDETIDLPASVIQDNRWDVYKRLWETSFWGRGSEYPVTGAFLAVDGVECRRYIPREDLKDTIKAVAESLEPEQQIRLRFPR